MSKKTDLRPDLSKKVMQKIADKFNLSYETLASSRMRPVCTIRAAICWCLRKRKYSLNQIAGFINRDHSTVINLLRYRLDFQSRSYAEIDNIICQHLPAIIDGMLVVKDGSYKTTRLSEVTKTHIDLTEGEG